ncbi:glucosyltransferase domain-containing protein [Enterococcus bulliens]
MRKDNQWILLNRLFWLENKWKFTSLFALYQVVYLTIGTKDYPYIDDVLRQNTGITDFAASYSRWGSEVFSWMIQGSKHLTDLGNMSFLISGAILTLASISLVVIVAGERPSFLTVCVSSLLGLNPWALQLVSFRFDSPYMALSILFSILPFLFWDNHKRWFFVTSFIGVFLMCNTYQASSGIYLGIYLTLVAKAVLFENISVKTFVFKTGLAASAYSLALISFFIESSLNPEIASRGNTVAIAKLTDIPATFIHNSLVYIHTIWDYSARVWQLCLLVMVISLLVTVFKMTTINKLLALGLTFVYLGCLFVFSYGVLLVFSEPLVTVMPRYGVGISIVFSSLAILLVAQASQMKFGRLVSVVPVALVFYFTSFGFTYASTLNYQQQSFKQQSQRLTSDLALAVTDERQEVWISNLFKDSPLLESASVNYPVLNQLVPRNGDMSWFNLMLLQRSSNLQMSLIPYDFTNFDTSVKQQVVDNYYWTIYVDNERVYVIMKR